MSKEKELSAEEILKTVSEICNSYQDKDCKRCPLNGMCDAWNIGYEPKEVIQVCKKWKKRTKK